MKVYQLIQILGNVCKYNPEGEVYFQQSDDKLIKVSHCEDGFEKLLIFKGKNERII